MTLQTVTFDGTPGASPTTAAGVTSVAGTGGTAVLSDTDKVIGATAAVFQAADGQSKSARCNVNSGKVQGFDFFVKTPGRLPTAGSAFAMATLRHASGTVLLFEYTSSGGLSTFEPAGGIRTAIPSSTVAFNTWVRCQILVTVGSSTDDSFYTVKVFSATSPFTTQIGTTLTRGAAGAGNGINIGTVPIVQVDGGAITLTTPGLSGGFDNLRADDGKTTDFTAPPAASAPTAVLGVSNQDPEEDVVITFNYTGSTAGTGTITNWELTCTEFPAGSPAPAIVGPSTATPTSTPLTGGQYEYSGRVQNSSGIWSNLVTIRIYVHAHNAVDVKVRRVISAGGWVVAGAAGPTSLLDALRNPSPTGAYWVESAADPAITDLLVVEMDPFGPDAISVFSSMYYADAPQDGHVGVFMPNATTLLEQLDIDLTATNTQYENRLQPADLVTATTVARRNLVVKVAGGPA